MPVKYVSHIKEVNRTIDAGILAGLSAVGAFVEYAAVQNITENPNVDTGRLRGSITYNIDGKGSRVNAHYPDNADASDAVEKSDSKYTVNVGSNVEYAARIEFIGGKGKPVGFLRKAVDENIANIQKILSNEMNKRI